MCVLPSRHALSTYEDTIYLIIYFHKIIELKCKLLPILSVRGTMTMKDKAYVLFAQVCADVLIYMSFDLSKTVQLKKKLLRGVNECLVEEAAA